ncbi:MAG: hypothetical protein MI976_05025 [Pseudomonadales bacterium]|nr:hypothetical protein [Pseudomonadales bacterium]
MYENVKNFLIDKGYKKHKASSLLLVKGDMLFTLSPQGIKNDINIWYAIYPLAMPSLWINMGWAPAAGGFPHNGSFPNKPDSIDEIMIKELETTVFPFFEKCESLGDLELLYSQGNRKAQYPRVFALLSIKRYEEAHALIDELIEEFESGGLGVVEVNTLKKFSLLKDSASIDAALDEERQKNIKSYSLVRHIKNANKLINGTPGGARH